MSTEAPKEILESKPDYVKHREGEQAKSTQSMPGTLSSGDNLMEGDTKLRPLMIPDYAEDRYGER